MWQLIDNILTVCFQNWFKDLLFAKLRRSSTFNNMRWMSAYHSLLHSYPTSHFSPTQRTIDTNSDCVCLLSPTVGFVDIKSKGCLAVADCNKTKEVQFPGATANSTTAYSMTKTCCNTDLCNAAPGLPSGLSLALATVTALFVANILVWKKNADDIKWIHTYKKHTGLLFTILEVYCTFLISHVFMSVKVKFPLFFV